MLSWLSSCLFSLYTLKPCLTAAKLAPSRPTLLCLSREPVDKATFLRNLWWCFDKLEEQANDDSGKPAYFRFLTLLGEPAAGVVVGVHAAAEWEASACVYSALLVL